MKVEVGRFQNLEGQKGEGAMFDLVLIDNDELIRLSWQLQARDLKMKVAVFDSLESFLKGQVALETPVYIDYHLDRGVKGTEVASELNSMGYTNLFITTGDSRIKKAPPYIKSIFGKDFPAA